MKAKSRIIKFMINYERRRKIILAAIAIVVVIFCVFIFMLIKNAIDRNNLPKAPDLAKTTLVSTSAENAVSMTVRDEIVADEIYDSYQIIVTPSARSVLIMKGYNKEIIKRFDYSNNKSAYEQFVYALDKAKITEIRDLNETENDTRGVCATGNLYRFDILKSGSSVKDIWTTSCRDSKGSMKASLKEVKDLFRSQLPTEAINSLPRI